MNKEIILKVDDLVVAFHMYRKGFRKGNLEVIHALSLDIRKGEILAVVGSSGSGKSLLAGAVLNLLPGNARVQGSITYKGEPLDAGKCKRYLGTEIAFIPQSVDYLDPLMRVEKQVIGVRGTPKRQKEVFRRYQLSDEAGKMYPFQMELTLTQL